MMILQAAERLQLTLGFRLQIGSGVGLGVELGLSFRLGVQLGSGAFS